MALQLSEGSSERIQVPQDLEMQEVGKMRIIRKLCKWCIYADVGSDWMQMEKRFFHFYLSASNSIRSMLWHQLATPEDVSNEISIKNSKSSYCFLLQCIIIVVVSRWSASESEEDIPGSVIIIEVCGNCLHCSSNRATFYLDQQPYIIVYKREH
jgi:hypothetical protein